jgi:hypothetical protein
MTENNAEITCNLSNQRMPILRAIVKLKSKYEKSSI